MVIEHKYGTCFAIEYSLYLLTNKPTVKKAIYFLAILISHSLHAQDLSNTINGKKREVELSDLSYYLDKEYVYHIEAFSHRTITLRSDQTYEAHYGSGGCNWDDTGKWNVQSGEIELVPTTCDFNTEPDCNKSLGDASIEVLFTDSDLYYSEYIQVTSPNKVIIGDTYYLYSMIFGVPGRELVNNEKRNFKGVDVVVMGLKQGITTSDVKIRDTPTINGKIINYWKEMGADNLEFVPKGETVEVIARTVNKEKIKKWENYWYLVNVGMEFQVWMFGEFVEFN